MLHARQQSISMLDTETGGSDRKDVQPRENRCRKFYAALATLRFWSGWNDRSMFWFLQLLEELGIEYRVGHPAAVRKGRNAQAKHDRRDATLISGGFWSRTGSQYLLPTAEQRICAPCCCTGISWSTAVMTQNGLQAVR